MCDQIVVESGMEGMMHLVSNVGEIFPDISSNNKFFPKYTMSSTSSMNGIAERRNRTLQDMVRSMMTG